MYGDVHNAVRSGSGTIGRRQILSRFSGPARLNPGRRDFAAVNQGIPNGIGSLMRQMHVVVVAAHRIGLADDGGDRGGVHLQGGDHITDHLLSIGIQGICPGSTGGGLAATGCGGRGGGLSAQAASMERAPATASKRHETAKRDIIIILFRPYPVKSIRNLRADSAQ